MPRPKPRPRPTPRPRPKPAPRRYHIKEETKALGTSQIMISLIHCALGHFWTSLMELEEKSASVGSALMTVLIVYSIASSVFFMLSGASSVIHKVPTRSHRMTLAIVLNIISVLLAIIGLMIVVAAFASFEAKAKIYSWSNMAGMMLTHLTLLSTIAELTLSSTVIHWMRRAFHHEAVPEEFSLPTLSRTSSSEPLSSEL